MPKGITPTLKQKKLAKNIKAYALGGIKTDKTELLIASDYTRATARGNAKKIMSQEGLQIALQQEGISIENADNVVKSILNSPIVYEMVTPDNQLRAADFIAKRLGAFAPEKLEIRKVVANITFNKPSNEAK